MTLTLTSQPIPTASPSSLLRPLPFPPSASQAMSYSATSTNAKNTIKLFRPFEDSDDTTSNHHNQLLTTQHGRSVQCPSVAKWSPLHLNYNLCCVLPSPGTITYTSATGNVNNSISESQLGLSAKLTKSSDKNNSDISQNLYRRPESSRQTPSTDKPNSKQSRFGDELESKQPRFGNEVKVNRQPRLGTKLDSKQPRPGSGQDVHCSRSTATTSSADIRSRFTCAQCDKSYLSSGALKMHQRTHTLPCRCTTCGKAFSRPWLLQGHVRTHTGERPFNCDVCGRAFADRSNLRSHQQTHASVKRHVCSACGCTFSRSSLLAKHATGVCKVRRRQQLQT